MFRNIFFSSFIFTGKLYRNEMSIWVILDVWSIKVKNVDKKNDK